MIPLYYALPWYWLHCYPPTWTVSSGNTVRSHRTHCTMGHQLSDDNLIKSDFRKGVRSCKRCKNDNRNQWRAARRQS